MGYNISVDHSKFESTAKAIDDYNTKMISKMKNANSQMTTMFGSWKGEDATAFKNKWVTVSGSDSTYMAMKKSLNSYSDFLRSVANKYKTAQANAINRANSIPKW